MKKIVGNLSFGESYLFELFFGHPVVLSQSNEPPRTTIRKRNRTTTIINKEEILDKIIDTSEVFSMLFRYG